MNLIRKILAARNLEFYVFTVLEINTVMIAIGSLCTQVVTTLLIAYAFDSNVDTINSTTRNSLYMPDANAKKRILATH